jgi:arsenite methyltransferase
MKNPNYGFDAPGVMRNLLLIGALAIVAGLSLNWLIKLLFLKYIFYLVVLVGSILFLLGTSMVVYGLKGKYRMRDFMLSKIAWQGNEMVLDIGTGRGLLMNGAARHLTTGKSIGIDIWRAEDLSGNVLSNTLQNAALEGVSDKIEVLNADARQLPFEDASFDVILSLFCIHNIDDKAERDKACLEMARVLKPQGKIMVAEYFPIVGEYAKVFEQAGLQVSPPKTHFNIAYSLMWMVEATK